MAAGLRASVAVDPDPDHDDEHARRRHLPLDAGAGRWQAVHATSHREPSGTSHRPPAPRRELRPRRPTGSGKLEVDSHRLCAIMYLV
ncbi:hypothetical protein GGTG_07354 [Gaeumannomyces tritici R3-111a-1]|uniref:Uncharacterized protein n=1 Tax=Gaeumannomyces tritici (strain R3-111a-1) TaxID=644352 RepID=J3P1F7_GAET3|nr:hypothetical protein GGTG_07354 [Gaeumannomyces tritici R3-111a-1]EJT77442.1 hypothetical protein GGTG_07354 [Gaeumannomyces tritici R3-111a-1]